LAIGAVPVEHTACLAYLVPLANVICNNVAIFCLVRSSETSDHVFLSTPRRLKHGAIVCFTEPRASHWPVLA